MTIETAQHKENSNATTTFGYMDMMLSIEKRMKKVAFKLYQKTSFAHGARGRVRAPQTKLPRIDDAKQYVLNQCLPWHTI